MNIVQKKTLIALEYYRNVFRIMLIFAILLTQVACVSNHQVYVKKNHINDIAHVDQVLIVVEYLEMKDDIKGLWNFDEDDNLKQQELLFNLAVDVLSGKGYSIADAYLKTSGLVLDQNIEVDHYLGKSLQANAITPPFIIRSVDLKDQDIIRIENLLFELNQPVSSVLSDFRSYIKNNYLQQTKDIQLAENMAILLIHSYRPKVSLFSSVDVGFAFSSSGNGASIGLGNQQPQPVTKAHLISLGSGDVIWSNQTSLLKKSNHEVFFRELPVKKH